MSFYHTKLDICVNDILKLCNLNSIVLDTNKKLHSFLNPNIAAADDLTFVNNTKYLTKTKAKVIITNEKLSHNFNKDHIILISNNLNYDIAVISNLFYRSKTTSEVSEIPICQIGSNFNISKNTVIGNGVIAGSNFFIDDFSSIGHNCIIGNNVKIGKNVSISNSIIGDNVSIGDGTKIGQSGFGFVYDSTNIPVKIFHIGRVIIQNNVSINTNCSIDRGSFSDTIIGENTFIDNLVHVAHNVSIGNNCMIAAQCGFAGSAKIGNFVQIGGQSGIAGHIEIFDHVKIAAKSGVIRDIGTGKTVMGYPAINLNRYLKNYKKNMM